MTDREKHLDWLCRLKSNLKVFIPKDFHLDEFEQSLDYAIASIKTDLKYDLLYEEALEQEPTTKNDLGVDCVVRQDVERYIEGFINEYTPKEELEFINLELDGLKHIPTVTPQEPILDKITKIIEPLRHVPIGEMSDIEWDILRVIDKYKGESEG